MPVITVTGLIGSGVIEIGPRISDKLGIDHVDRTILAEAARKMGASEQDVAERTERAPGLGDRIAGFVKTVLERSALAGGGADPYFGGGLDALLVREYRDFPEESHGSGELDDENLLKVTSDVIHEIASGGNVVIAGRGSNVILRDVPNTLHVGLISSMEVRVDRIMRRESLGEEEAVRYIQENDRARIAYFKRFFDIDPQEARHYHQVLNTDMLTIDQATEVIVATAQTLN